MRIRNAFPVFGLLTTLALAGCSTSSDSASVDDKGAGPTVQTAQIFDDAYGVTKDAGYSLPAIPIDRVKPQFRRQVVNYETTERPGTIIVNTRERFLYYILANGKAMLRRFADHMCAVTVREKQAAIVREDIERNILVCREEQPITMQAIVRPLAVDTKILDRGLDLDDPDLTFLRNGDQIRPSPARKRQFGQDSVTHLMK
jgi:hypothetical protein